MNESIFFLVSLDYLIVVDHVSGNLNRRHIDIPEMEIYSLIPIDWLVLLFRF